MYHGQIKIFAKYNSPRLKYIAGLLVGNILGSDWNIVTDKRDIGDDPVINYSSEIISGSLNINPYKLLYEEGINPIELSVSEWKGLPVFFMTDRNADIPFDIFSASFYLVTRYEEYLDFQPDMHGRFQASSSISYKHGFLGIPVVDLWVKELASELTLKYPGLVYTNDGYKALLTIDSDQPFAYLGKNLARSIGGLLNDVVFRKGHTRERVRVLTNRAKDPFEVYDYITSSLEATSTDARFFFPAGRHTEFDKNPSWKNDLYRGLIERISSKYKTGLHPSYYASDNYALLKSEKGRLSSILGREVTTSRFHFLRLKIPVSYKILSEAGILEDYTLGFPEEPGFRAGIARPFMFYDLNEEKQTGLRIIPLQVMDATLFQYMKLDALAAEEVIMNLIAETRKAGGLFVSLWHNTSLIGNAEWADWRKLFEKMLKIQQP